MSFTLKKKKNKKKSKNKTKQKILSTVEVPSLLSYPH